MFALLLCLEFLRFQTKSRSLRVTRIRSDPLVRELKWLLESCIEVVLSDVLVSGVWQPLVNC